ncbi:hypothetical protein AMELA_G00063710 [Ameiurus melas]|uniref:Uncharacterized protein n=1 Tax=Ameiurus melas TaxID=219545 RepID=A0A7J6B2H1_AMEME|nr:hypothetical protein AMELA_G00063710 [Ameiurus melas]
MLWPGYNWENGQQIGEKNPLNTHHITLTGKLHSYYNGTDLIKTSITGYVNITEHPPTHTHTPHTHTQNHFQIPSLLSIYSCSNYALSQLLALGITQRHTKHLPHKYTHTHIYTHTQLQNLINILPPSESEMKLHVCVKAFARLHSVPLFQQHAIPFVFHVKRNIHASILQSQQQQD